MPVYCERIYRSYKRRCTVENREERVAVRFRTIETVQVEDSERVLAVLEQRLRAMVSNVEREGNRITLLGLGPSSRAINRHDTTVIDVWAEDGVTNIGADVNFQASAFLAATSQEEIMRLKLERLFDETREQLHLESRHDVARIARMEALVGGGSSVSRRIAEEVSNTQPASDSQYIEDEPSPIKEQTSEVQNDDAQVSVAGPSTKEEIPAYPPDASATNQTADTLVDVENEDLMDNVYDSQETDEEKSDRWILWAALAAFIVAVLPFGVHYISTLRADKAAPAPAQAVTQVQAVATERAKPVAAAEPADLLRQWELAMQSQDAAAQASFYAVPVDRYFLGHNVSKAQVQADKQQQIDSRKGIWGFKMEKVKITRTSDNTATVTLVKHYMQQEAGRPVKEWFVPSQLKLKSEFGVWWITSERNLFAPVPSSAP
jgi:hypothetical protein